jgi:hypothetical protein
MILPMAPEFGTIDAVQVFTSKFATFGGEDL